MLVKEGPNRPITLLFEEYWVDSILNHGDLGPHIGGGQYHGKSSKRQILPRGVISPVSSESVSHYPPHRVPPPSTTTYVPPFIVGPSSVGFKGPVGESSSTSSSYLSLRKVLLSTFSNPSFAGVVPPDDQFLFL